MAISAVPVAAAARWAEATAGVVAVPATGAVSAPELRAPPTRVGRVGATAPWAATAARAAVVPARPASTVIPTAPRVAQRALAPCRSAAAGGGPARVAP